ncbi:hypothetical protein SAMN05216266_12240 [Amycolatopsis marina]|uniref:Uncharacterized protein n=1 Tax=Amycolatopsis marina TaxID=490629 RepID=A0A1I1C777_9PSEU|nr:hypothetical protein SAMN05216266_12240 [Amycolatopsis marina]
MGVGSPASAIRFGRDRSTCQDITAPTVTMPSTPPIWLAICCTADTVPVSASGVAPSMVSVAAMTLIPIPNPTSAPG